MLISNNLRRLEFEEDELICEGERDTEVDTIVGEEEEERAETEGNDMVSLA
jgi:hypothetical protein